MENKAVIIDFHCRGNVIRFFLGRQTEETGWYVKVPDYAKDSKAHIYYGDDWDDCPYDCNAGEVYDEFIDSIIDVAVDYDSVVTEPRDGVLNCNWSKDDMVSKKVPCVAILPSTGHDIFNNWNLVDNFEAVCMHENAIKVYFGNDIDTVLAKLSEAGVLLGTKKISREDYGLEPAK